MTTLNIVVVTSRANTFNQEGPDTLDGGEVANRHDGWARNCGVSISFVVMSSTVLFRGLQACFGGKREGDGRKCLKSKAK
jgi:hypothetical protein